jgi:hypothetical protein
VTEKGKALAPVGAVVPEGWKLVPVEPTRGVWAAMGTAAVHANRKHHDVISEAV